MKRRGVELRLVVENRASLRRIADMPDSMAEGVGFEPTSDFRRCRFSRPVPSTARPPLHARAAATLTLAAALQRGKCPARSASEAPPDVWPITPRAGQLLHYIRKAARHPGPPMMLPRRGASPRSDAPAALHRRLRHDLTPRLTAVVQFTAHPLFTPKHHSTSLSSCVR
jgi:hypothetical protein